jgi:peptide/nickel transport system ATP-binding protein
LHQIDGSMPRLNAIPTGCAYHPRCPKVFAKCEIERPDLMPAGLTRSACWLHASNPVCPEPVEQFRLSEF